MPPAGLSARSVIASTLLGTHPPSMEGRLLVAFAARFGIAEGTARVALSRMVERGELTNEDGRYSLAGHLVDRQARQDASRSRPPVEWDGSWTQAVVVSSASPARRNERRVDLSTAKLAELREGLWLRPSNLDIPAELRDAPDIVWGRFQPDGEPRALVGALWDTEAWAAEASELITGLEARTAELATDDDRLAESFVLAAAVLRHIVADPELPPALWPECWPTRELRTAYDRFETVYQQLLRRFFKQHR